MHSFVCGSREGAACSGAPLRSTIWNLQETALFGISQIHELFSFLSLTLNYGLVRGDLGGEQNKKVEKRKFR